MHENGIYGDKNVMDRRTNEKKTWVRKDKLHRGNESMNLKKRNSWMEDE